MRRDPGLGHRDGRVLCDQPFAASILPSGVETDEIVLVRWKKRDDPLHGLGGVDGMERGEDEVTGLRRGERGFHRLAIAHLPDENHIGALP